MDSNKRPDSMQRITTIELANEFIDEQVKLVREEAKKIDEKFKIFMGNEIYFGQDVPEWLAQRKILTMNGSKYVLIGIIKDGYVENITDDTEIRNTIKTIIENNPESVADYKNGHDRAIKYLMGQVMKETKGKANPKMLNEMFLEELKK